MPAGGLAEGGRPDGFGLFEHLFGVYKGYTGVAGVVIICTMEKKVETIIV